MYKKEIFFKHNEIPARINAETREVTEIKFRGSNIPKNKERFIADEMFSKSYIRAWEFLVNVLSPLELKIAIKMSTMARMNTNSLAPLDDNTSIRDLAEFFNIGKNSVKKSFKKLFYYGVYASFEYNHHSKGYSNEWIFNPYISFKGKLIDSDVKELFGNTIVGKLFNN